MLIYVHLKWSFCISKRFKFVEHQVRNKLTCSSLKDYNSNHHSITQSIICTFLPFYFCTVFSVIVSESYFFINIVLLGSARISFRYLNTPLIYDTNHKQIYMNLVHFWKKSLKYYVEYTMQTRCRMEATRISLFRWHFYKNLLIVQ